MAGLIASGDQLSRQADHCECCGKYTLLYEGIVTLHMLETRFAVVDPEHTKNRQILEAEAKNPHSTRTRELCFECLSATESL